MNRTVALAFLLVALPLITPATAAPPWEKSQRLGKVIRAYDRKRPETVSGTVVDVYEVTPANSPEHGYHLVLKTEKELLNIHLGPGWYLRSGIGAIAKGDTIGVSGAQSDEPVTYKGNRLRAIRAASVSRGDSIILQLRDAAGKPVWSGM